MLWTWPHTRQWVLYSRCFWYLGLQVLLVLVESAVQGMYFLDPRILGLVELPGVLWVYLMTMRTKVVDLQTGQILESLGPVTSVIWCQTSGESFTFWSSGVFSSSSLPWRSWSIGFGPSCASSHQLPRTLMASSTFKDTSFIEPRQSRIIFLLRSVN